MALMFTILAWAGIAGAVVMFTVIGIVVLRDIGKMARNGGG